MHRLIKNWDAGWDAQLTCNERKDFNNDETFSPCRKTFNPESVVIKQSAFVFERDSV
jgi:hypothetical protein